MPRWTVCFLSVNIGTFRHAVHTNVSGTRSAVSWSVSRQWKRAFLFCHTGRFKVIKPNDMSSTDSSRFRGFWVSQLGSWRGISLWMSTDHSWTHEVFRHLQGKARLFIDYDRSEKSPRYIQLNKYNLLFFLKNKYICVCTFFFLASSEQKLPAINCSFEQILLCLIG